MTNGNDQINQQIETDYDFADVNHEKQYGRTYSYGTGLTKREYFAAMAMQGMSAACQGFDSNGLDNLAKCAVQAADAIINELNK